MNSGQVIKDIMNERGIKQKWLATRLDIAPATLSTALTKCLSFEFVIKLCDILNISIDIVYEKYIQKKDTEHPAKNVSVSKSGHE